LKALSYEPENTSGIYKLPDFLIERDRNINESWNRVERFMRYTLIVLIVCRSGAGIKIARYNHEAYLHPDAAIKVCLRTKE